MMRRQKDSIHNKSGIESIRNAEASISRYCAYQERTVNQVNEKLKSMNISEEDSGTIISKLISEGFINEQRFAIAYTLGKLNQNKWGRLKISHNLKAHGISGEHIEYAFSQYGEDRYRELAFRLIGKKLREIKDKDPHIIKQKAAKYMIVKGFESNIVWAILNDKTRDHFKL